jgi:hypothetical protein
MDNAQPQTAGERLSRFAAEAEAVGDRSAAFIRAIADDVKAREELGARLDAASERFEEVVRWWEARPPNARLSDAQVKVIARDLTAKHDEWAGRFVTQRYWKYGLGAGGAAVLTVVAGIAGGIHLSNSSWDAGYAARVTEVQRAVDGLQAAATQYGAEDAVGWLNLMRLNRLSAATRNCGMQSGRLACSFAFWVEPGPSAVTDQVIPGQGASVPPQHVTKGGPQTR